jgi:hypothetical protein
VCEISDVDVKNMKEMKMNDFLTEFADRYQTPAAGVQVVYWLFCF